MQIVFQEPFESLNPRMRVGDIVAEPVRIHEPELGKSEQRARVASALAEVGLGNNYADRYARTMSGGQQQRVGIARALVCRPSLLVLDEPTSSLDLSVQAQILEILHRLQREHGIAYLYISHDLSTVSYIAHRVAVMYLGQIRELGTVGEVVDRPADPYTQTLLGSYLSPNPDDAGSVGVAPTGEITTPTSMPTGCYFFPRCGVRRDECAEVPVELLDVDEDGGRQVRCLLQHPPRTAGTDGMPGMPGKQGRSHA
jgi:peptide/nickel transport system ATP-binding protein/oligopeptide transport system ATP-binding protein